MTFMFPFQHRRGKKKKKWKFVSNNQAMRNTQLLRAAYMEKKKKKADGQDNHI